LAMKFQE